MRIDLDEAELLGDGAGRVVAVGDLVGDRDEQARLGARVVPVGEHRALLEQRAVALDDQVGHRVEQGVARGEEVGLRLALGAGQFLGERDPLVLGEHRCGAGAGLAVAVADVGRDVADLVASGFAFGQPAAELLERFPEEGADVVRLEAETVRLVHPGTPLFQVGDGEDVGVRGPFGDELVQARADSLVDDLVETRADFGTVAVADCFDEQVLERLALERLAEHVEDLARGRPCAAPRSW